MKKTILTSFLIIISITTLSAEKLTLKRSIELLREKSYISKKHNLEKEKLDIQGEDLKYEKWDEGFDLNSSYDNDENLSLGLDYNILDYSINLREDKVITQSIGVSKNLKDFIYSRNDYEKLNLKYQKEKQKISETQQINSEIIKLIDIYKEIINLKDEKKILNLRMENMEKEIENLRNRYEMGKVSDLEVEYAKIEYLKKENDVENLESRILSKKRDLKDILGVDMEVEILESEIKSNVENKVNFENINKLSLENQKISKEEKLEAVEYSEIQEKPDVTVDLKRDIENEDTTFGVSFRWNGILNRGYDDKKDQVEIEQIDLEMERLKREIEKTKKAYIDEYENLKRNLTYSGKHRGYVEKEWIIVQKRYKLGKINYFDYNEKSLEREEAVLSYKKAVNELSAFKLKMNYRD